MICRVIAYKREIKWQEPSGPIVKVRIDGPFLPRGWKIVWSSADVPSVEKMSGTRTR